MYGVSQTICQSIWLNNHNPIPSGENKKLKSLLRFLNYKLWWHDTARPTKNLRIGFEVHAQRAAHAQRVEVG